jgi:hypothetical protein
VEHVRLYSRITGNYNPLHADAEFTAATLLSGCVPFGQLSSQRRARDSRAKSHSSSCFSRGERP